MIQDMTGEAGMGWQVATEPHRCSGQFCPEPAVAFYASNCGGYGYSKQVRHVRRRYRCARHLGEWSPMWVQGDRVLADFPERVAL